MMRPSLLTIILAVVFGIVTALQDVAILLAIQRDPVSYTMMFSSFSIVITALSGILFFNEDIAPLKCIGVILMLVSFTFAVDSRQKNNKSNVLWLILCMAIFIGTGGIGIIQKVHQSSTSKNELDVFLVIAFFITVLVSFCASMIFGKLKFKEKSPIKMRKRCIYFLAVLAVLGEICVVINNKLNLFL